MYHVTQTNQSEHSIYTTWHTPTNHSTAFTPPDTNQPIRAQYLHHLTLANQSEHSIWIQIDYYISYNSLQFQECGIDDTYEGGEEEEEQVDEEYE